MVTRVYGHLLSVQYLLKIFLFLSIKKIFRLMKNCVHPENSAKTAGSAIRSILTIYFRIFRVNVMAAQFQSLLNSYGDDVIDKNTTLLQVKMPTTIHSTDSMLISVLLKQKLLWITRMFRMSRSCGLL